MAATASYREGNVPSLPLELPGLIRMMDYSSYPFRLPNSSHLMSSAYRLGPWLQKWHVTQVWPIIAPHYSDKMTDHGLGLVTKAQPPTVLCSWI